ncbi:MAG TPA: hypothetical protein VJM50_23545 [Pyrinomonadaceae bacterium]|nr:hypothetical protein [Pyrinomonadaceae bacterium]
MTPAAQFRPLPVSTAPDKRAIPFDYAFRFELKGQPGNVINSVVTVSIEATFTAVSIGYGVVATVDPIVFGPVQLPPHGGPIVFAFVPTTLAAVPLADVLRGLNLKLPATSRILKGESGAEAVLKNGIKLNAQFAELALSDNGQTQLSADIVGKLFQVVGSPPELILFKYAIFDEGSGREFQSEPILNIAGLGSADGERPFRHFAQPIVFRPRSTIRMEVTEVSDFKGDLHVSLHGFKVLGDQNSPTAVRPNQPISSRR